MNSVAGTCTKLLTFVPLAILVYYRDFSSWYSLLFFPQVSVALVAAGVLFAFGCILKRRILAAALELSRPSYIWGFSCLLAAAALYVYGSYSPDVALLHLESLVLLVISYVSFRIGPGIIRSLGILVAIISISVVPSAILVHSGNPLGEVLVVPSIQAILLILYVRLSLGSILIPALVIVTELAARSFVPFFLIPWPLLLLVSSDVRRLSSLPVRGLPPSCKKHKSLVDGFCFICGRKISRAAGSEPFGTAGLITVAAAVAVIILVSVPILSIAGDAPYQTVYGARGSTSQAIPPVPSGWQVNSSRVTPLAGDIYAEQVVYVPAVRPEVSNYTMYYALSLGTPVVNAPTGDIAGWLRLSNNFTQIGVFQGYITTYESGGRTMLVYTGTTHMTFLYGPDFVQAAVGVGFVREFEGVNASAAAGQFLNDLETVWLVSFTNNASFSAWTGFLASLYNAGSYSASIVLLSITSIAIAMPAYAALRTDDRIATFYERYSRLAGENWRTLSALMNSPGGRATGYDLAHDETGRALGAVDTSLDSLRELRLIRGSVVERGSEPILAWRAWRS